MFENIDEPEIINPPNTAEPKGCSTPGACSSLEVACKALKIEAENAKLRVDAERYRWLRKQHWSNSTLVVVSSPKENVQLGTYCPSDGQLDAVIDEIMAASQLGEEPI